MKKIKFLLLFLSVCAFTASAQQIGNGYSPVITDFSVPLLSGIYSGTSMQPGFPAAENGIAAHLITARATNIRNYQMQIASSFREDDRMFFRKTDIQSLSSRNSPWHELATRGQNAFTDHQYIAYGKSLIFGKSTDNTKRFRIYYSEPTTSNPTGDAFLLSGGSIYFYTGATEKPVGMYTKEGNLDIGWAGLKTAKRNLKVNGKITANEIEVKTDVWADYVFADNYQLPSLEEVKNHIQEKKHLPGIPSESEAIENGVNIGDMQVKLLQKIEELTLYVIQQQEDFQKEKEKQKEIIREQQQSIENLKEEIKSMRSL